MAWLRRAATITAATALAAAALIVLNPDPPKAQANLACDIGIAPGAVVTGAVGIGNPVGDACEAITDPVLGALPDPLSPIKDAASSIGQGVFKQITAWATDGATWLLGEVVALTDKTTSPNLLSKGFVRQYREMASIATVLALLMLLFAVLESLGRGDGGMLVRVFLVNVPLAAIATSAAYVVVQLLIATTDGFCEAIAHSTATDTRAFFKSAIEGLASVGGDAGTAAGAATEGPGTGAATGKAAGTVAVPMFVGFIAAIVAAFAAFLVWIELLMRDAAIYAVALFMPLAIAASIWPRWMSALRRTAELVIVVVFSKFVIVAVIALAASLLAHGDGGIEQVLAAGALLLLACFSPFVLFKLVPFAEGAVGAAFSRQSAAGAGSHAIQTASSLQMMRATAHANWGAGSSNGGGGSGGKSGGAGGSSKGRPGGGWAGSAGDTAEAGGGAGGVATLPVTAGAEAVKGTKAAAGKLGESGTAQAAEAADGAPGGGPSTGGGAGPPARPATESSGASAPGSGSAPEAGNEPGGGRTPRASQAGGGGGVAGAEPQGSASPPPSITPNPTDARGGGAPGEGEKPARPGGTVPPASKPGSAGKGQA